VEARARTFVNVERFFLGIVGDSALSERGLQGPVIEQYWREALTARGPSGVAERRRPLGTERRDAFGQVLGHGRQPAREPLDRCVQVKLIIALTIWTAIGPRLAISAAMASARANP
jgi:hypothetical protein